VFLNEISRTRKITPRDIFQGEATGDLVCCRILEDVIRLISINLGGVVNTLDLEMLILGGGVAKASPNFIPRINSRIRDFLMTDEAKRDLRVIGESFSNSALFGAAADVFIRQGILEIQATQLKP
jgi:glucokinase